MVHHGHLTHGTSTHDVAGIDARREAVFSTQLSLLEAQTQELVDNYWGEVDQCAKLLLERGTLSSRGCQEDCRWREVTESNLPLPAKNLGITANPVVVGRAGGCSQKVS